MAIFIMVIGYRVYSRFLKHKERQDEEETKKFCKALDSLIEMKADEYEVKKVQSLSSHLSDKSRASNVVEGKFDESNRLMKELHELATDYVSTEIKNIFSGNVTPVCDSGKKTKKVPKKEKEHVDSEIK